MRKSFVVSLSLVGLSACAGTDREMVGSGPMVLQSQSQTYFEQWQSLQQPLLFVVTEAGQVGDATHCPSTDTCRTGGIGGVNSAIRRCEQRSGQTCYLYARNGEVVWDFDAPAPDNP
ncbi:MAG: hypothetical protein ACFB6S_13915 [Geminicoccaceae bacterium]